MSTFTTIKCACGAVQTDIDIFDRDLNYDAAGSTITCSQSCKSIRDARVSWIREYDPTLKLLSA